MYHTFDFDVLIVFTYYTRPVPRMCKYYLNFKILQLDLK